MGLWGGSWDNSKTIGLDKTITISTKAVRGCYKNIGNCTFIETSTDLWIVSGSVDFVNFDSGPFNVLNWDNMDQTMLLLECGAIVSDLPASYDFVSVFDIKLLSFNHFYPLSTYNTHNNGTGYDFTDLSLIQTQHAKGKFWFHFLKGNIKNL